MISKKPQNPLTYSGLSFEVVSYHEDNKFLKQLTHFVRRSFAFTTLKIWREKTSFFKSFHII